MNLYGTSYGGFYLPTNVHDYLNENSVIYTIGVGEDISFDVILANVTGAPIYMYDPTPRAIEHVKLIQNAFDTNTKPTSDPRYGGGDLNYIDMLFNNKCESKNLVFTPKAITHDEHQKMARFYQPKNKDHVSCSLLENANHFDTSQYYDVECTTLIQEMKHHGHKQIDLLKLDVEGVECDILNHLFGNNIFPKIINVEFDILRIELHNNKAMLLIKKMNDIGYKLMHRTGFDFTFIRQLWN